MSALIFFAKWLAFMIVFITIGYLLTLAIVMVGQATLGVEPTNTGTSNLEVVPNYGVQNQQIYEEQPADNPQGLTIGARVE